jgi:hypothetical protein
MTRRSKIRTIVALAFLAACAVDDELVASSSAPILGGSEDDDMDPNTRAVGYLVSRGANFCSAALVRVPGAPGELDGRVVLTAAHCLTIYRRADPQMMGEMRFGVGREWNVDPPYRVVAAMDHPRFAMTASGDYDPSYDVAVLILDRRVSDRAPLEIDTVARIGASYTHVGYGQPSTDRPGGIKRRMDAEFAREHSTIHDADGTVTRIVVTKARDAALCPGDSGGAMLLRGKPVLAGIHSTAHCAGNTENSSAQVSPLLPWVNKVLDACRDGSRRTFFPETGIWVCGAIADALASDRYGGVAGIGLPISSALYEKNWDGSDKKYFFQWFQRNRVEHVPDADDPEYRIAFGRLGAETIASEGDTRNGSAPNESCSWMAKADGRGAWVCDRILQSYEALGGMRMLGAPVTMPGDYRVRVREGNEERDYAVRAQWFERGRLEEHPSGVYGGLLGCRAASLDRPLAAFQGDGDPRRVTLGCSERLAESFDGRGL